MNQPTAMPLLACLWFSLLASPSLAEPARTESWYRQQVGIYLQTQELQAPSELPFGFDSWQEYHVFLNLDLEVKQAMHLAEIPATLNWSPEIRTRIEKLFESELKGQVAVFDADETLWRHDVGEGFLKFLQMRQKLVMVPPGFDAFARYEALCAQNKWMGYPYAAQVMAGMQEADVRALAKEFFEQHFQQNVYPAQKHLIQRLQQAGVEVYIVSASNQWIVEAGAPYLGVPLDHVIGIRLEVNAGQLTPNIIPPMTFRQGKVDAINSLIGKQPVLVSGDSMTDYEMLKLASRLQLLINPKDKGLATENIFKLAREHGWPIQQW